MRFATALALLLVASPVRAAAKDYPDSDWELGFMLGAPTGVSVKHWLGSQHAIDAGVGIGPGVRLHVDYLFELARPVKGRDASMGIYLGGGGLIGLGDRYCAYYGRGSYCGSDFFIGGRVPFGLDVPLTKAPVAFGLELAPGLVAGSAGVGGLFDVFVWVRFVLS